MPDVRRTFHQQLESVREDIVRLAAHVIEAVPRATAVLLDGDLVGAKALIDDDAELDDLATEIEERCYMQLALQQPMAGDLRELVAALRLTSEIERSGDLAVNIVKGARRIHGVAIDPKVRGLLQVMSDEARRLFVFAVEAYADGDDAKAAALEDLDDALDDIHRRYIAQMLECTSAGNLSVQAAVQLALIGRYYERIGDHAVKVGQQVRFVVTGERPAHGKRSVTPPSPPPRPAPEEGDGGAP